MNMEQHRFVTINRGFYWSWKSCKWYSFK